MTRRGIFLFIPFLLIALAASAQRVTYNKVWQVSIPTNTSAFATQVFAIDDKEYLIGYQANPDPYYSYLMKVDSSGVKLWSKSIADAGIVELIKANDGGYVLVLNDYSTNHFLVIKLTVDGNEVWRKTFAGTAQDNVADIVSIDQTSYLILATSNSNKNATKTDDSHGGSDYWAIKIDNSGNKVWDKTFGGAGNESAASILARPPNFVLNGLVADDTHWEVWINKNGSSGKAITVNATGPIREMLDFTYAEGISGPNANFRLDSTFIAGSGHFNLRKPNGNALVDAQLGDGTDDSYIYLENVRPLLDKRVLFTWSYDWGVYLFDGSTVSQLQTEEGPFNLTYTEAVGYTPNLDIIGASGTIGNEGGHVTVTRHRVPEYFVPVFYYSLPQHNLAYSSSVYFYGAGCRWMDYTNDGVLDFMVYNNFLPYSSTSANIHLFTNSGGKFSYQKSVAVALGGPPYNYGETDVSLGDYNRDGYTDFVTWNDFYINNKNKDFVKTGVNYAATNIMNWGDVDQDGDYDLFADVPPTPVTLVNNGQGQFVSRAMLANEMTNYGDHRLLDEPISYSKHFMNTQGDWPGYWRQNKGDFDNDADNDRLVFNSGEIIVYENRTTVKNQQPTVPQNLNQSVVGPNVQFSWSASTDDNTAASAISYNVYLRKDLDTLIAFNSFRKTGVRKIVNAGNSPTTSYTFKGAGVGTYFWSVQSVDGSYRGSSFATEKNFFITNNPTNITLSNATIAENSASVIGTLTTSDVDAGETFTYSLVAGTGSTDNALFKITGASLSALSASSLNFESKSSYSIRIRTTDSRQGTFEKTFAITVTNVQETATDITLSPSTILENQPVATTIGTLTDNDPDAGDTRTYTLVAGTGSADNASFQIIGNALKSKFVFNYEVKSSYSVRIQTSDQAGNLFQKAFTIIVLDVNDLLKPTLGTPSLITQTGFTLAWAAIEGATSYEVEISSDNFVSQVPGFNPATVGTTSLAVINLSPGTIYQVRMRALELTYKSVNSDPIAQITVPANPTALDPTQVDVTGFTAGWSPSAGASSYELEVSVGAGTFTPMAGYNPKVVAGAVDFLLTGLLQGTIYKYRVRAVNGAGKSGNSNEKSVLTATPSNTKPIAQPTNLQFTSVTTTSLSASFTAAVGSPDGYLVLVRTGLSPTEVPVDGVSYTTGAALGNSLIAYSGSSSSFSLSSLSANTIYSVDLFSYKEAAGVKSYLTTSPLEGSHTTLALPPTSQPSGLSFTDITIASATVSFGLAAGTPAGYLVIRKQGSGPVEIPADGAVYTAGTAIGTSAVAFSGSGSTFAEAGLSAGVGYSYSVFAYNGAGEARNYLETAPLLGNFITLPNAPVAKQASNATVTSFTANWDATTGAATYELDVSIDNFVTQTTIKDIVNTEQQVNGLSAQTDYKYQVRAVNPNGGKSANSNRITARTSDPPPNALKINTAPSSTVFSPGTATVKITVNVTGGVGVRNVVVQLKGIIVSDFTSQPALLKSGDDYEAEVAAELLDELGLEYFVEVTDGAGTYVKQASNSFIYKSIVANALTIPFAPGFTGKTATYQMFSIPYELADNDINKIFDVSLGGYDNTKWRLFHYSGDDNKEYPNQFLEVKPGEGYWFNTILTDVQIKIGTATVAKKNRDDPFVLSLAPKWNQIGNPYPFSIRWSDVVGSNTEIDGLNFWSNGKYSERDVLKPWEGAFVFNSGSSTVNLPVPLTSKTTGGRLQNEVLTASLDRETWKLDMNLTIGYLEIESGIGMHPEGRLSKDKYDRITLPRFIDYAEMYVGHPEFSVPYFATDIMPASQEQSWTFDIASNLSGEKAALTWAYADVRTAASSLILIDLLDKTWVDMKAQGSYSFIHKEGRKIKIIYNRNGEFSPGMTMVGGGYPNPFSGEIRIPLLLESENMTVTLNFYNLLGQRVKRLSRVFQGAGMQEITWDGKDEQGAEVASGVLLYKLDGEQGRVSRIIKQ